MYPIACSARARGANSNAVSAVIIFLPPFFSIRRGMEPAPPHQIFGLPGPPPPGAASPLLNITGNYTVFLLWSTCRSTRRRTITRGQARTDPAIGSATHIALPLCICKVAVSHCTDGIYQGSSPDIPDYNVVCASGD